MMRGANAFLAALTLCCACRRLPGGAARLDIGAETRSHAYDPAGKLLYLRGDYPKKNYFCVYDLAARKEARFHFSEHRLIEPYLHLGRLNRAVLYSEYKPGDPSLYLRKSEAAALYGQNRPIQPATEMRLLIVDLGDGSLVKELPLAPGSVPILLAMPEWSEKAFVVLQAERKTLIKPFDPRTGVAEDSFAIGEFTAEGAAFAARRPILALNARDAAGRRRLSVYDLKARRTVLDAPRDSGLQDMFPSGERLLARYNPPGEVKSIVALIDLATGAGRDLAVVEDGVESMTQAGGRILAIGRDRSRSDPPNDLGYHPRALTLIDPNGTAAPATVPWTKREGRFLGYDAKAGRTYFAASQPASVWAFDADREALVRAAKTLDDRAGEFFGTDPLSWALFAVFVVVIAAVWGLYLNWPAEPEKPRKY